MKRQRFVLLQAALLAVSLMLTGCGNNSASVSSAPSPSECESQPKVNDYGYAYVDPVANQMGTDYYKGMDDYLKKDDYGAFPREEVPVSPHGTSLDEMLGVVHAGGQYNFTSLPYLEEGAGIIRNDLHTKVVKLWLTRDMKDSYPYNSEWGDASSIVDVAKSDAMKKVFEMSFTTYILETYEYNRVGWSAATAISQKDLDYVTEEFYQLAVYLQKAYNTYGKTFILQNWEGDNELTPALQAVDDNAQIKDKAASKQIVIDNYIAYSNARQAGIEKARKENTATDVKVYGALEVNFISYNGGGQPKVLDVVVPHAKADLFSFSDWSTDNKDLADDLETLNERAPKNNPDFPDWNLYLGEFGCAENNAGVMDETIARKTTAETMKIAIEKGVRYVCYWELNCNERLGGTSSRPDNEDMKGFWLIRPDGTYTETFWYFKGMLENKDYLSDTPRVVLRLPPPEPEAIPLVEEDILFLDNFDAASIDKDDRLTGYSDGMTLQVIRESDRGFFDSYIKKYGLSKEMAYTNVQKKHKTPTPEYIQYDVVRSAPDATGKFILQGFIYDNTPQSIIKVTGSKDGSTYTDLDSVYVVDKSSTYGYLYVTTEIPAEYISVRVVFTNEKTDNTWDPLVFRAAFLK